MKLMYLSPPTNIKLTDGIGRKEIQIKKVKHDKNQRGLEK